MEELWGFLVIASIVWIVIINLAIASKFDAIAIDKGYESGYGFWVFFTGIFGMIMVAALPDRGGKEQKETPKPEELPEI